MQGTAAANLENGANCGGLIFGKVECDVASLEKLVEFRVILIFSYVERHYAKYPC